jgi:hypothetical protein
MAAIERMWVMPAGYADLMIANLTFTTRSTGLTLPITAAAAMILCSRSLQHKFFFFSVPYVQ